MRYSECLQTNEFTMTWYGFWEFDFAVAGLAFVFILAVVAVRGLSDLRQMFRLLDQERRENPSQENQSN